MDSIADRADGSTVLDRLRRSLKPSVEEYASLLPLVSGDGAFAVLVAIILSQNTNDKNAIRAYNNLKATVGVDPEKLLDAGVDAVSRAIRAAGLYRQKARAIIEAARVVVGMGGDDFLLKAPANRVREALMSVRGVGEKTVDVFLSVVRGVEVFAVDTHARRIAVRWGLAGPRSGYREISEAYRRFFNGRNLGEAHRLIIALGRRYCTSRRPRCSICPVRDLCPYASQASQSAGRGGRLG
ncbi:MAG: endonuclease III [Desulfurococcales archaeon]|nr:endonuclease III [Desulfurococcales archaeon]